MRLSNIVTRKGDSGQTSIGSGETVSKDHPRVQAMGAIDHLNSTIGWSIVEADNLLIKDLECVQNDLFDLGADLAVPNLENKKLKKNRLEWLEKKIENINNKLKPLSEFVLPGGSELSSRIHLARSECKNAERRLVSIHKKSNNLHIPYLNRLSDYLFVLARFANSEKGQKENMWNNSVSNEL